jgi:hypothetical protein
MVTTMRGLPGAFQAVSISDSGIVCVGRRVPSNEHKLDEIIGKLREVENAPMRPLNENRVSYLACSSGAINKRATSIGNEIR